MIAHPLARMITGLSVGFAGAVTSVVGVEWLGSGDGVVAGVQAVIGEGDFRDFCASRALGLVNIGEEPWRCGGFVNGLWTTNEVTPATVCAEVYGLASAVATVDSPLQWRCVNP